MNDEFASRLREAMFRECISQQELAAKLKISKSNISQYLSGKRKPTPERLREIASVLNVSHQWLNGIDEIEKVQPEKKFTFEDDIEFWGDEELLNYYDSVEFLEQSAHDFIDEITIPPIISRKTISNMFAYNIYSIALRSARIELKERIDKGDENIPNDIITVSFDSNIRYNDMRTVDVSESLFKYYIYKQFIVISLRYSVNKLPLCELEKIRQLCIGVNEDMLTALGKSLKKY